MSTWIRNYSLCQERNPLKKSQIASVGNACHGIALDCALCATDQYVCVYEYVKLHQFLANAIFMVVRCHGHLSPSPPWPQQSAVNAGQAISYLAPWPPCSEDPGKEQEKTDKFSI